MKNEMNVIAIGCSALKYTVSIDTYMNGKMMSTNRKNYRGRQIIFALIAFSIASMIMTSITVLYHHHALLSLAYYGVRPIL